MSPKRRLGSSVRWPPKILRNHCAGVAGDPAVATLGRRLSQRMARLTIAEHYLTRLEQRLRSSRTAYSRRAGARRSAIVARRQRPPCALASGCVPGSPVSKGSPASICPRSRAPSYSRDTPADTSGHLWTYRRCRATDPPDWRREPPLRSGGWGRPAARPRSTEYQLQSLVLGPGSPAFPSLVLRSGSPECRA